MKYEEDFRCPYCKNECHIIRGYHRNYSPEYYVMTHCKKHMFILFSKQFKGFFVQEEYWTSRQATTSDFRCRDCIHWGFNQYSKENGDHMSKACSLNVSLKENPDYNPEYDFRMSHTIACKKFKHIEVNKAEKKTTPSKKKASTNRD